ncbi:hypothetical protein [Pararhodobacter sp. SW119]|uniref:hypothetical protein n=1 Tax=Pararhodobacter sp. SW119 TaxID=2780075 RepID=UPI001AE03534|nr:hypothetical protein [Pararhodobacter sp. SW119]
MPVTQQNMLDAMDGVVMVLDAALRIKQVGEPNWVRFRDDNPPQDPTAFERSKGSVLDRPITDFFAGDAVRATFTNLFNSVLRGARPLVRIDYRCDAPTVRREMRLAVTPIASDGQMHHLLYQSITFRAQPRPAVALFGAAVTERDDDAILTLCAICARVAWPVGAPTGAREWIEPTEYYRRDGGDVAMISHGFCEACFARLKDED